MNVALHSRHLNILSICTGGGGLDLGFELAIPSARTVCMVEREGFAVAQLVSAMEASLMGQAPIWSDARTFNGRAWRGAVDGLIGGIPCQPHSVAGRKKGQHDERDLWSSARRIIVQSGAWFVLIENVGGMLSAGDDEVAGAARVWGDLRKLGFEVEGGLFTAAEVGAPHQRERIFILAVANRNGQQRRRQHEFESREGTRARKQSRGGSFYIPGVGQSDAFCSGLEGSTRREVRQQQPTSERSGAVSVQPRRQDEAGSDPHRSSLFPPGPSDISGWRDILASSPELEPAFRRVANGLASRLDIARVDRLRMLGNGVVPLEAAYAIRTLASRLARRGSAGATELVRMMETAA